MQQNVFINYTPDGVATNAFSVVLGSEDGSFGIRRLDNGQVVVTNGTAVANPSTGLYEYPLDVDSNVIYEVSWTFVMNSGDAPQFIVQQVGPFFSPDDVRAVPVFQGTFNQGSWATLFLKTFDLGGSAMDVSDVSVSLVNADTSVVAVMGVPEKLGRGYYMYDWPIPEETPTGTYNVIWRYTVRGGQAATYETITISPNELQNSLHSSLLSLIRVVLERYIPALQAIPVFRLQAEDSSDNKNYYFAYKNWNQFAGVRVYRGNREIKTGFTVDYQNGCITFNKPNLDVDVVHATFNFRFFSDDDLNTFLLQGLNKFNIFAPHTGLNFVNIPDKYVPPVIYGAAVDALRTYLQQLMWPQYNALYATPERADKAYEQVESLKKDYEEEWKLLCEEKKKFPYRGLHQVIVAPWFTVPGGRARFARSLFLGGSF